MKKGILLYISIILLLVFAVGPYFFQNITFLLSDQLVNFHIGNRWDLVGLYIGLFSVFILFFFVPFKRDQWQKSSLMYVAFIVALFTEMFGFPLTIYLLSSVTTLPTVNYGPIAAYTFDLWGFQFKLLMTSLVAGIISAVGVLLIIFGWRDIYLVRNSDKLATRGLYRYMRHPQYTGILMITTAWLFAWPTLVLFVMWPILVFAYYKLARREERYMEKQFGKQYDEYRKNVPMFLPGLNY